MNPLSTRQALSLAGALLLLIPVGLYVLWIYAINRTEGYPQTQQLYYDYLPLMLRGRLTTNLISLACCAAAVWLNAGNLKHPAAGYRLLSWMVVIVGSGLGFLNLFSMM